MKIFELFETSDSSILDTDFLFEDLGTLEVIDKEFLKLLKTTVKFKYQRSYGGGTNYVQQIEKKLPQYLGQNSKTELVPAKSGAEIHRTINDDANIKALVIEFDGRQSFALLKVPTQALNKIAYFWVCSWDKLMNLNGATDIPEEYHDAAVILNANDLKNMKAVQGNDKELYKALTSLLKVHKMINGKSEIKVLKISNDDSRQQLRKQREQSTSIPRELIHLVKPIKKFATDTSVEAWEKNIGSYLKNRLEAFKAQHAETADSPEEFLKKITEKGFLDKFRINGLTYERSNSSNLHFDNIKNWKPGTDKNDSWNKSYIEYSVNSFDPGYEEYENYLKKIREGLKELISDEDEYHRQMSKYRVPRDIKVYLKFEGGTIVPAEISVEKFTNWKKK